MRLADFGRRLYLDENGSSNRVDTGFDVNNGQWHHYVSAYNSTTKTLTGYVDGVAAGVRTNWVPSTNPNDALYINNGASQVIDEVAIYDYPLSAATVFAHFSSARLSSSSTSLVGPVGPWSNTLPVSFTATVTTPSSSTIALTGTVRLFDGASEIGSSPLAADGTASFSVVLPLGSHIVTVRYSGSVDYVPSSSAALVRATGPLPIGLASSVTPNPGKSGQPVLVQASIELPAGMTIPATGFATVRIDGLDVSISLNVSPRNIEDHSLEEMVRSACSR